MEHIVSEGESVLDHVLDGLGDTVGIDLFEEAVSSVEELVDRVDLFGREADLTVDHLAVLHQPLKVITGLDADVETVTGDVIELVDVDAVAGVGDNVVLPSLRSVFVFLGEDMIEKIKKREAKRNLLEIRDGIGRVASDQVCDETDVLRTVIELVVSDQVLHHPLGHVLVMPIRDTAKQQRTMKVRIVLFLLLFLLFFFVDCERMKEKRGTNILRAHSSKACEKGP